MVREWDPGSSEDDQYKVWKTLFPPKSRILVWEREESEFTEKWGKKVPGRNIQDRWQETSQTCFSLNTSQAPSAKRKAISSSLSAENVFHNLIFTSSFSFSPEKQLGLSQMWLLWEAKKTKQKKIDRHTGHEHGAGACTYIFIDLFWHHSSSKHRCLFRLVSPNLNLFLFLFFCRYFMCKKSRWFDALETVSRSVLASCTQ